ncbi:MAG: RNA ligase [Candidatus Micrarchaeota archaeon]
MTEEMKIIEDSIPYLRHHRDDGKNLKGTVVFLKKNGEKETVSGYLKIPRAFHLGSAFRKIFGKQGAYVEEKMDGYNVRTCVIDGEFKAITRGGLVCSYTTERLNSEVNGKFFDDNPELMLCGEVVGLQNPYQEKSYPEAEDFGYFVFDIRRKSDGKAVSIAEKEKLLKKYRLPHVRGFGLVKSPDRILKIVRKLGDYGREGVVLKSADMTKILKYTANQSTNRDLEYAFEFYNDYGQAFMFQRLVREAFQAYELGLKGKALEKEAAEMGKSVMIPLVETIRKIAGGAEQTENFEIEVPSRDFGTEFVDRLKHLGVVVTVDKIRRTKQGFTFSIKRHYHSTNDKTKSFLNGGTVTE